MKFLLSILSRSMFVPVFVVLSLLASLSMASSHIVKVEEVEVVTRKEASTWDKAKKEAGEAAGAAGEAVKESSSKAWDATKSTSHEAWKDTKEGASKAADYTKEKSSQAWDKTKEVSKDAWDATKDVSEKAADAAKEEYGELKEKIAGSKK